LGFITRGQELLGDGNISSARLLFKRAADVGLAYGALFLGQTYDPNELALYKVRGIGGDPAAAKQWYERAYALGAPEADALLRRLNAN
jgi:TPR repeat protein